MSGSSLFYESGPRLDKDVFVQQLAWSNVDPVAALACNACDDRGREIGQIVFINNEGTLLHTAPISHPCDASVLAWQPNGRILAIGWNDGMVSCWLVDGKNRPTCTFSNNSQHNSAISVLKWNPFGKRLVTGDKKGIVCVWSTDSRGSLSHTRQYRKTGGITCAVFCVLAQKVDTQQLMQNAANTANQPTNQRKFEIKQANSPPFFFGTEKGAVVYADDLGHCTDVQQLTYNIDIMLFYEERARLVIITRNLMLTQYQVADDGRVSRLQQVKLSVAGDVMEKGLRSVAWAGPGVLAAATKEKMVRLLDLAADESYNLSTSKLAIGDILDKNDRDVDRSVTQLAFGPLDRFLAIGTAGGAVAIWKYMGPIRESPSTTTTAVVASSSSNNNATPSSSAKGTGHPMPPRAPVVLATAAAHWELQYKTLMQSPILQISWYGGNGAVAVVTEDGVTILTETIMRSGLCGSLRVIQTDTHEVSIHLGGQMWLEKTHLLVQGMSVSASCFAVWSGKSARVYRVDAQLSNIEPLEPFVCPARAMAIADTLHVKDEVIFAAEGGFIKILNYGGVKMGEIAFSEADGVPEHLDINAEFLSVVTSKGVIQIYDVRKPKEPKAMGAAGKFNLHPVGLETLPDTDKKGEKDAPAENSTAKLLVEMFGKGVMMQLQTGGQTSTAQAAAAAAAAVASSVSTALSVKEIKVNCKGNRVAILAEHVEGALQVRHRDSQLYVFDHHKGAVYSYDFGKEQRTPISIFWDESDDRMLVCEAVKTRTATPVTTDNKEKPKSDLDGGDSYGKKEEEEVALAADVEIVIFFATTTHGLLMQDSFPRKSPYGPMIGFVVPRVYFRNTPDVTDVGANHRQSSNAAGSSASMKVKVYSKVMRDFIGMDNVEDATKKALLDFSYNVTQGKLDEAYRAVKTIGSASIWENMAHMCVKTKRLDVAEVCLGHMGHARGAAAVRESRKEGSIELSIGVLAISLGLLDDAARLFREAGRFDYLNRLYQAAGIWDKAVKVSKTNDRIHLKNTHYQFAKHLESIGDIDRAIEHYERSETARTQVPRMLFSLGRMEDLEDYIHKSSDSDLLKWWAAYLESEGRLDKAKKYYKKGGDFRSLVRLSCFEGDFTKAAEIVSESGDRAAAYYFAQQMEQQGHFMDAVNFYADAGCYNHSIRLTRAYNLDAEIMRFAVRATPSLMLDCAMYFESKGEYEKAVQLFHKGGDLPRAMDLCFRAGETMQKKLPQGASRAAQAEVAAKASGLFEMLNTIAQELGADTSPQTLARCAEFLVKHKQYVRAIELYVMAKRYVQAIEMCEKQKVVITDEMVEQLTPAESTMDASERKDILKDLGHALKKQGSFVLASKKYTQAGDRVRAMKCLVRGGDTKAVIQFANISRNAEIYKLAANYLQQMNWREAVDIMKAIIQFYTKAQAFEQLAGFYDSCAQVEIDDYRDYEKAIGALKEALKYLGKAQDSRHAKDLAEMIDARIGLIERFVRARKAMQRDPETMVEICVGLLKEPLLEDAIRSGDCLAMLVEYYHGTGNMKEAFVYVREMESRNIALNPYVDAQILEEVFRANGAREGTGAKPKAKAEAKGGGGGMDPDHDQRQEMSGAKGPQQQQQEIHGHGDGERGGGDDDSDIEEDLGNDSPIKVPQKGGGGGGGYAAAKHPTSVPIRGEEKKPTSSNSTGTNRPAAKGVSGGVVDTEESLDEEIGEEVDDEVDSPPKPVHKNRK